MTEQHPHGQQQWPPAGYDVLPSRIALEIVRVVAAPVATHLRSRVRR
jgi:hypothetical protein